MVEDKIIDYTPVVYTTPNGEIKVRVKAISSKGYRIGDNKVTVKLVIPDLGVKSETYYYGYRIDKTITVNLKNAKPGRYTGYIYVDKINGVMKAPVTIFVVKDKNQAKNKKTFKITKIEPSEIKAPRGNVVTYPIKVTVKNLVDYPIKIRLDQAHSGTRSPGASAVAYFPSTYDTIILPNQEKTITMDLRYLDHLPIGRHDLKIIICDEATGYCEEKHVPVEIYESKYNRIDFITIDAFGIPFGKVGNEDWGYLVEFAPYYPDPELRGKKYVIRGFKTLEEARQDAKELVNEIIETLKQQNILAIPSTAPERKYRIYFYPPEDKIKTISEKIMNILTKRNAKPWLTSHPHKKQPTKTTTKTTEKEKQEKTRKTKEKHHIVVNTKTGKIIIKTEEKREQKTPEEEKPATKEEEKEEPTAVKPKETEKKPLPPLPQKPIMFQVYPLRQHITKILKKNKPQPA